GGRRGARGRRRRRRGAAGSVGGPRRRPPEGARSDRGRERRVRDSRRGARRGEEARGGRARDGDPLRRLLGLGGPGGLGPTDATTGEATWDAVPAGRATVSVMVPGRLSLTGLEVTTPRTDVFEIRLGEGGAVRGRVADATGKPVAGADVLVSVTSGASGGQ